MAVILVGGLCVLVVGFLIFMSIVSAVIRMFAGGSYNRGGYNGPPSQGWGGGWGFGRSWGSGYGHHQHTHHAPHHPKPSGGGFKLGGFGGHKPSGGHQNKPHFGGGGSHKKW